MNLPCRRLEAASICMAKILHPQALLQTHNNETNKSGKSEVKSYPNWLN